jgi:hypothetical protein
VRKYLYLAMAAASVTALAAPAVAAQAAPAAKPNVLTIAKAGGKAVKAKDKLSASLAKKATAVFKLGSLATVTCKSSTFTAVVVKNPTAPGTATESQTAETIAKCTVSIAGATVKSVTALNLPYNASVSDKKGFPVTVSARSKSKLIELTAVAAVGPSSIKCTYETASIAGSASNKGNTVTIKNQKFSRVKGSNGLCPSTSTFSATYGPVKDTSVKGSPAVFVN